MTVWVFRARLFHSFCERGDFWYTDIAKFAGHLPHRYGNSVRTEFYNLWKLIYLATEALSDSFEFIGAI